MMKTDKSDQVLLDLERRAERTHQLEPVDGRRLAITATIVGAAVFSAGCAAGGLFTLCDGH